MQKLWVGLAGSSLLWGPAHAARAEDVETWSIHGQSSVIEQWRGDVHAPYSGANSLNPNREDKHTATLTLFLGRRLWPGAEIYYDPEVTQGNGLSGTVGVAGFPNGEATRAGSNTPEYNTARLFLRQTFDLGGGAESIAADQNELAGPTSAERLTFTLGKLSAADIFDANTYCHAPRTQFLNWALMDNGAWDYPADTKGYTGGLAAEWRQHSRTLRWGLFMEPREANGRQLDAHLAKAWGQVFEWEERYTVGGRAGALRPFFYWNRADMGSYAQALQGAGARLPDVTLSRSYRSKAGAGLNWEQEMADDVGMFARIGFNDGHAESWAFTEIDRTVTAGVSVKGSHWGRANDTLGVAGIVDGLSAPHRRYLAAGGAGFIVGDGRLAYAPEEILETYYNWKPTGWLALAIDYQWVSHPAYNRDRGPASVFALRTHLAF